MTRDPEHLRLARLFDHRVVFDPLARGEDPLDGLHANTQIPKAIGAERDCELTGEARYCRAAETFWSKVALDRSYAIGGHSEDEHFFPVAHFSRHLGESTAETCNTYNMLKLSRGLFLRDALPSRIEFYERALFNHILASNDPATGLVTYSVSMKPGAWRTYSTLEDSFWCCVGTGMENPARFGEAIYARSADSLYVNLFLASEVAWREKGLRLRQLTRFPEQEGARLELALDAPSRFSLRVRRPAWAGAGWSVSVNGRAQPAGGEPGAYVALEREWHDGDVVELRLPMSLRAERMPDDASVVAFLQGPIVLAADLGGAPEAAKRFGPSAPELRASEAPQIPTLVAATTSEALAHLQPTGEPLTFRSSGIGRRTASCCGRSTASTTGGTRCTSGSRRRRHAPSAKRASGRQPRRDGRSRPGPSTRSWRVPQPMRRLTASSRSVPGPGRSRAVAAAARATADRGATRCACPRAASRPCA